MIIPRNDYPRPSLVRGDSSWISLNGQWDFEYEKEAEDTADLSPIESFSKKITVPFVPESHLSGIEETDYMKRVWYRRTFTLPESFKDRCILHFGAVDYQATVWVNGKKCAYHRGGYTPFSCDITALVHEGENTVCVSAYDDVKNKLQASGKQCEEEHNHGCYYTRCTGIWQSVWLESVPENYIEKVKILPDVKNEKADLTVKVNATGTVNAKITFKGEVVCEVSSIANGGYACFSAPIPSPVLWDVGQGNLYDVELSFGEDKAYAYFGMRCVETAGRKLLLNSKPLFQRLVLDQGYYPGGIYTPESADQFAADIDLCMAAGFNGARMHMKIFEPRFIYEADRKGYLLWGEYPNWGLDIAREEASIHMIPEWLEAIERDVNSPSIIGWCPFNESWPMANFALPNYIYDMTKAYDPTRLVIDSSGWIHTGKTDIYDSHDYDQNPETFRERYQCLITGEGDYPVNYPTLDSGYDGRMPYFVSEFGGSFFDLSAEHENAGQESGDPWGYGEAPRSLSELEARIAALCGILRENPELCGFCYTQFTDVMQEMNGLFTMDRTPKLPLDRLKAAIAGE